MSFTILSTHTYYTIKSIKMINKETR